ncbi:hypothetical protein IQ03_04356 [Gemmobacter caeni]|nr:hypothetical protein IQ03_04356 [Gemmobacter caeni]
MIRTLHEGLLADGLSVPLTKLCAWFGVPRRTVYYKPTKAAPKVDPSFAEPIKAMIEKEPSFGYRTVAWLLGYNKNTVQRIFQIKGWPLLGSMLRMRLPGNGFASARSACDRASKQCPRSRTRRTSAGPPTCAESGQGATAGQLWPSSSTATPASCWAGICRDPARQPLPPAHWSMR